MQEALLPIITTNDRYQKYIQSINTYDSLKGKQTQIRRAKSKEIVCSTNISEIKFFTQG